MSWFSGNVFGGAYITGEKAQADEGVERLHRALEQSDTVLVGAGAGLSTAAGLTYTGERFHEHFADFRSAFGIRDMYSGGFYPFPDEETYWGWWCRHIYYNRYDLTPGKPYLDLLALVKDKDHFVLTTNVDHQFQIAGFDKERLFYTQGDYGLFQCSVPCTQDTYDNEECVRAMIEQQQGLRVPSELIPHCPKCGATMTVNLRADDTFVEDAGWHEACKRYERFLAEHRKANILYLELGVGSNTPGIVKYPFWRFTAENPQASYACINLGETFAPKAIEKRSILIDADLSDALGRLRELA